MKVIKGLLNVLLGLLLVSLLLVSPFPIPTPVRAQQVDTCSPSLYCIFLPITVKPVLHLPINNGDFELGADGWNVNNPNIITIWYKHTGNWGAHFNGTDDRLETLSKLPVPADSPYLGLWIWIQAASYARSSETFSIDVDGVPIVTYDAHVDTSSTNGWEYRTLDLRSYAGQEITLAFHFLRPDSRGSFSSVSLDDLDFTDTR